MGSEMCIRDSATAADAPLRPLRSPRPAFDVRRTRTTNAADRDKLLAVIEGSGEGIGAFNDWVGGVQQAADAARSCCSSVRASTAGSASSSMPAWRVVRALSTRSSGRLSRPAPVWPAPGDGESQRG